MKLKIYQYAVGAIMLAAFTACDFERVNTNEFEMLPEEGFMDAVAVGGSITSMQKCVVPVGTQADGTNIANEYQTAYNLAADCWSGYFGQNNNWSGGYNNLTYYLIDSWISNSYRQAYSNILPLWQDVMQKSKEMNLPEVSALAQILKISAWHKATDMFGPIPYKEAGKGLLVVPYDDQKTVYTTMLEELAEAIATLTDVAKKGDKVIPDFDAVYAGKADKWVIYANSLMLRLAMRCRYADEAMAQKYAEKAVKQEYGVMTQMADEAKMSTGAGLTFINNLTVLSDQYNECRMGMSMLSYLGGYEDPRIAKYFTQTDFEDAITVANYGNYQAIPPGSDVKQNDKFKSFSRPNVTPTTPTYWMRASEVYFLRAEGKLYGWDMGSESDASLYSKGIAMSFEENGVDADVNAYMQTDKQPLSTYFYVSDGVSLFYLRPIPTSSTTQYTGTQEEKFEKIMTQKWIALFPNGQEAWTEWRRTGYPKLLSNYRNNSGGSVTYEDGIRRMPYPRNSSLSADDQANLEKAVQMLEGGIDSPSTRLWWDKK